MINLFHRDEKTLIPNAGSGAAAIWQAKYFFAEKAAFHLAVCSKLCTFALETKHIAFERAYTITIWKIKRKLTTC